MGKKIDLKLRIEAPAKPRNPLHSVLAETRSGNRSGSHRKSDKAVRLAGKQELRRQLGHGPSGNPRNRGHNDKGDSFESPFFFSVPFFSGLLAAVSFLRFQAWLVSIMRPASAVGVRE